MAYRRWTEEDYKMHAENLAARPYYTEDGIRRLYAAVCLRAIQDYKSSSAYERRHIKDFFDSDMFAFFTNGIPGDEVARIIDNMPEFYMPAENKKQTKKEAVT